MRTAALLLGLAIVACKSTADVEGTIPDDVAFIVVVELDDNGGVRRAGPLAPRGEGPVAIVADRDHPVVVFGFSQQTLESNGLLEGARQNAGLTPLSVPDGACEPHLPAADWSANWTDANTLEPTTLGRPQLTAPWMNVCPVFEPEIGVDVPCRDNRCGVEVEDVNGCNVTLTVGCDIGRLEATVWPNGEVCAQTPSCSSKSSVPGAQTLTCLEPKCDVAVYVETPERRRLFDVEVVSLADVEPTGPQQLYMEKLFNFNKQQGFYTDFVVLDDRIVLTGTGDIFERECPHTEARDRRMAFVDLESLAVTSTMTAPTCLRRPVRDPFGDGFVAIFGDIGDLSASSVGRFDRDGRLVTSVPLGAETYGHADQTIYAFELVSTEDRLVMLVSTRERPMLEQQRSTFVVIDARTLRTISRASFGQPPSFYSLAERTPNTLLAIESDTDVWHIIDLVNGEARTDFELPLNSTAPAAIWDVYFHAPTTTYLTGGEGNAAAQGVREGAATSWQANFGGPETRVMSMATWPADESLVFLAGGRVQEPYDGAGGLLDVAAERIVDAPQRLASSTGTLVRPDGRGRLLVLHPWSAELSRVTPY